MDVDFDQLRALAAVVDEGTFEAAARRLSITASAVSQRVKALESATGRVLVNRSKPVRPTESGSSVLRLARQVDLLTRQTARELGEPAGVVSVPIVVNADSLETWVLPALRAVPDGVSVEIHREDQEHSTNLLRDGTVMAAVTSTSRAVQGCVVTRLGVMRYRPMASPEFTARWFGDGVDSDALARSPVVVFDRKDDLQDGYLRRRCRGRVDPPRCFVPSSAGFAEAVRLGLGWGMLPDAQSCRWEADGEVVDIDPGTVVDVPLYWQQPKLRSAVLSGLAEAVRVAASTVLR